MLHNCDHEKCVTILGHVAAAMRRGYSKVLIDEFAIPDQNACAFAMRSDLMVMALAGSVERTEGQWRELLAATGLEVDRIWSAQPQLQSILEASHA
jgi:hypothetical protein